MREVLFETNAPAMANLTLFLEISMGIGLTFGGWMARRRQYRLHAGCQSLIVLLNTVVIAVVMVPSFQTRVHPKIPERLGRSFYALATAHAILASVAEVAAICWEWRRMCDGMCCCGRLCVQPRTKRAS